MVAKGSSTAYIISLQYIHKDVFIMTRSDDSIKIFAPMHNLYDYYYQLFFSEFYNKLSLKKYDVLKFVHCFGCMLFIKSYTKSMKP